MHRLHPAPPIPRRHIQQHRPILRQPRGGNLVLRRNKRRHNMLVPPPPPAPNDKMPPRRLFEQQAKHAFHAARIPNHWERAEPTAAES